MSNAEDPTDLVEERTNPAITLDPSRPGEAGRPRAPQSEPTRQVEVPELRPLSTLPSDRGRSHAGADVEARLHTLEVELKAALGLLARQQHQLDRGLLGKTDPPPAPEEAPDPGEARDLGEVEVDLAVGVDLEVAGSRDGPAELAQLTAQQAGLDRRLVELTESLRRRFAEEDLDLSEQEARLAGLHERVEQLEAASEVQRLRMKFELVNQVTAELEARTARVEIELQRLDGLQERVEQTEARTERLESLFAELVDELRGLREQSDLDAVEARLRDIEALALSAGTAEKEVRQALAAQGEEIEELKKSVLPPANDVDDLTQIDGIGPKTAASLRDLGITAFAQIRRWSAEDIERVAAALGQSPRRIEKAGWVAQAAERDRSAADEGDEGDGGE